MKDSNNGYATSIVFIRNFCDSHVYCVEDDMKFTVTGCDNEEQKKMIEAVLEDTWPTLEPHYFSVFKDVFFKEICTGIKTSKEEYEKASIEVLTRAGLLPRKF